MRLSRSCGGIEGSYVPSTYVRMRRAIFLSDSVTYAVRLASPVQDMANVCPSTVSWAWRPASKGERYWAAQGADAPPESSS